jgi:uncharacterized protein
VSAGPPGSPRSPGTAGNKVALLDVNVLLALFDPDHTNHEIAHDWFADNREFGWATCPLTENGFLRTAGRVARASEFVPIPALVDRLRTFRSSGHHQFWPDDISLLDERLFNASLARGHQQLTDVYLLGLAVKRRGRLATFDQKIPLGAVKGATRAVLEIISARE